MKRLLAAVIGLGLVGLLGIVTVWRMVEAVNRRANAAEATEVAAATPVETFVVAPRDLVDEVSVPGTLRGLHEADVVAQVPGTVRAVLADVGDPVTKGQPLLRLDDEELALAVAQAEAGLAAAQAGRDTAVRDLAGADSVATVGGVTDAQLVGARSRAAAAEAQVKQAAAAVGLARARLADAVVRAPFAGVVVRRAVDVGRQLNPGMPAFGVADLSALELVVPVDERVAAHLHPADSVALRSDTVASLPAATVKTVSPALDANTHKAEVVLSVPATPGLFAHGAATAVFQLGRADGALALPSRAVVDDRGEHVVYVVDGDKARRVVVQPGLRDGDWVGVTGVTAGAQVVVSGNSYLSDGAAIRVHAAEPS